MRLWTLHPRYLDAKGLVALWREGLLAQKVLQGATRGYQHHPQLIRFREAPDPETAIATYLDGVLHESVERGYAFNRLKIATLEMGSSLVETEGQLLYEWQHLQQKLRGRDPARYGMLSQTALPEPHPMFQIVPGAVRSWERLK